jgi:hypothetical protein|tara:strand:+ start:29 stop:562 length:534 start_codon:yes stop_codon:yes gene_type:complete
MYLPKSKYKGPFTAADGAKKVLVLDTKEVYKGKYFVTYKDELFEGRFPKEAGRKLIFQDTLLKKEEEKNTPLKPIPSLVIPVEADYENKKFKRYFSKDRRSGKIVELSLKEFKKVKKYPSYKCIELEWWIEGPVEDTSYNGYIYKGAATRNLETLNSYSKDFFGIKDYLYTLDEFVV